MSKLKRDVVVIGAGPSGLTAARDVKRAGLSVAVLEARDRVGGRTWTDTIDGAMLEIGGQWVSPDQTAPDISFPDSLTIFPKTPELPEGTHIEVTVVVPAQLVPPTRRMSMLEFVKSLPPGPRAFDTWEEYEKFLQEEKNSWER